MLHRKFVEINRAANQIQKQTYNLSSTNILSKTVSEKSWQKISQVFPHLFYIDFSYIEHSPIEYCMPHSKLELSCSLN